ncbi:hypothetical protein [Sphingomonas sp. ACRSK]|uniref:hypothetical protein n=1 Tax=Sphingomonas sp. ACRSK TaxID=2918213 RepID=UPI001EF3E352|nr:hypothetical protein [Sphingomonas sp. ACRSK]MCG7349429.1 hypothetical protein [Sphingomonas sp. ACRSK]
MTRSVSDLADGLMRDAAGLHRRADALLETIETMLPNRLAAGAAAQTALDHLAAAASLARRSARSLEAANMRLQLLGAVIAALSVALESGSGEDDAALAENARQLRLLLHDCAGCRPN